MWQEVQAAGALRPHSDLAWGLRQKTCIDAYEAMYILENIYSAFIWAPVCPPEVTGTPSNQRKSNAMLAFIEAIFQLRFPVFFSVCSSYVPMLFTTGNHCASCEVQWDGLRLSPSNGSYLAVLCPLFYPDIPRSCYTSMLWKSFLFDILYDEDRIIIAPKESPLQFLCRILIEDVRYELFIVLILARILLFLCLG